MDDARQECHSRTPLQADLCTMHAHVRAWLYGAPAAKGLVFTFAVCWFGFLAAQPAVWEDHLATAVLQLCLWSGSMYSTARHRSHFSGYACTDIDMRGHATCRAWCTSINIKHYQRPGQPRPAPPRQPRQLHVPHGWAGPGCRAHTSQRRLDAAYCLTAPACMPHRLMCHLSSDSTHIQAHSCCNTLHACAVSYNPCASRIQLQQHDHYSVHYLPMT